MYSKCVFAQRCNLLKQDIKIFHRHKDVEKKNALKKKYMAELYKISKNNHKKQIEPRKNTSIELIYLVMNAGTYITLYSYVMKGNWYYDTTAILLYNFR